MVIRDEAGLQYRPEVLTVDALPATPGWTIELPMVQNFTKVFEMCPSGNWRLMSNIERDMMAFHLKFEFPVSSPMAQEGWPSVDMKMIEEEARELTEAIAEGDRSHIAQEAMDTIYIAMGVLMAFGIPFQPVWDIVHQANMGKEVAPMDMKPIKPEGWEDPLLEIRRLLDDPPSHLESSFFESDGLPF